jgi:hypothetical protein
VYRGSTSVPGAIETLNQVVADGVPVVFATNSASRLQQPAPFRPAPTASDSVQAKLLGMASSSV